MGGYETLHELQKLGYMTTHVTVVDGELVAGFGLMDNSQPMQRSFGLLTRVVSVGQ